MTDRFLFNLGVNILAEIFLVAMLFLLVFSRFSKARRGHYFFSIALVTTIIAVFINGWLYIYRSFPDANLDLIAIFQVLAITGMLAAHFTFLIYILYMTFRIKKYRSILIGVMTAILIANVVMLVVNYYNPDFLFYFKTRLTIVRQPSYALTYLFAFIALPMSLFFVLFSKDFNAREKVYGAIYTAIPLIVLPIHLWQPELSLMSMAFTASYLILLVSIFVEQGITIMEQQKELSNSQIRIMISQIQPHFIYNSLSSISELCKENPDEAVVAIDTFAAYLRGNFTNLAQDKLIPFEKELEHTKNYLKLEKMRFGDRLKVVYKISSTDFLMPCLSLQPIVENAVKHGICKKNKGGTITISTSQDYENFYITIKDTGAGFDINKPTKEEERIHVGLSNVEYRVKNMCGGSIKVESIIKKGTTVTICLPKDSGGGRKEK